MHQLLSSNQFTQLLFSIPFDDFDPTTNNVTVYNYSLINSRTTSNFTMNPVATPIGQPSVNFRRLVFLSPNRYFLNDELQTTAGNFIIYYS